MPTISRRAWFVTGSGLILILVAEAFRGGGILPLRGWGALWAVGWIVMIAGLALAVDARRGWLVASISLAATAVAMACAGAGMTVAFALGSAVAVAAMGVLFAIVLIKALHLNPRQVPTHGVIFGLAGVGTVVLAGAFALLASGLPLGWVAFACAFGLCGVAFGLGVLDVADQRQRSHTPS
jgi:hypothetical protein